ncbi:MAG: hypothetical protein JNK48_23970 [Bryobacterales bacterium]|nr:hypothetical protein [Bryobacterales bacterium]
MFTRRLFLATGLAPAIVRSQPRILDVRRIWNQAPHNAFTDLVRFRRRWFCAFREGQGHASPDGRMRILTSQNARDWTSASLVQSARGDLRDAKLCVTPAGQLMLSGAAALTPSTPHRHHSLAWFSNDGVHWSEPHPIGDPDFWLWRVTWHGNAAYSSAYSTQVNRNLRTFRLYRSEDGRKFHTLVENLGIPNSPGESTIRFAPNGDAVCLLRRDPYTGQPPIPASAATALIGRAQPPYTKWTWQDTGTRVGGPNFIQLPDGRHIAALRLHDNKVRTALCWLDVDRARIEEFATLPSSGDSSYAGLVLQGGTLHVSYYSTHEDKTSIYLAQVKL